MAEPIRTDAPVIELTMTPEGPLDEGYARAKSDAIWQELLNREGLQTQAEAGPGAATPEQLARVPAAAPKPSAIAEGAKAAFQAAGEGARNAIEGLSKAFLPQPTKEGPTGEAVAAALGEKVQGVRQALVEGLGGMALAPFIGLGAGARQALENANPDLANAVALEPLQASFVRMMMGGGNPLEQPTTAPVNQPMTVGEALDLAVQSAPFGIPGAAKGAKKLARAVKENAATLKGQRGAIGKPPTPPPAGAPGAEPVTPLGEPAPGAESRLNVERIEATDATKQVMDDLTKLAEGRLEQSRQRVSHAETVAAGQEHTLADVLKANPETMRLQSARGYQSAIGHHFTDLAQHVETLTRQYEAGDESVVPALAAAGRIGIALAAKDEMLGSTAGRLLEARKIMREADLARGRITPEQLAALGAKFEAVTGVTDAQLAAAMRALTTRRQQRSLWRAAWDSVRMGKDFFHDLWVSVWLLSGPQTNARIIGGNLLSTLWDLPERATSEIVGQIRRDPDGVKLGETWAALSSSVQAAEDGLRYAGKAWQTGEPAFGRGPVDTMRVDPRAYGFDPDSSWIAAAVETIEKGIHSRYAPGRAHMAAHTFFKGLHYRWELNALATREALSDPALRTTAEIDQRIADLKQNPTDAMMLAAQDEAIVKSLTEPLGVAGQAFLKWANNIPGGRVLFPFVTISANVAKWTARRAPLLSFVAERNRNDLSAGGAAADRAWARIAMGHAVGAVIAYEVMQGNITGQGDPKTRKMRDWATGARPYSLRVGDKWVACDLEPACGPVRLLADFAELQSYIPDDQDAWDRYLGTFTSAAEAFGSTFFVNQSYTKSLADMIDLIRSPSDQKLEKMAAGVGKGTAPIGVQALTREQDGVMRDARTLLEGMKVAWGVGRTEVPPYRNWVTGEPVYYPPGLGPDMLPVIYMTKRKDDPVMTELFNLGIGGDIRIPSTVSGQPEQTLPSETQTAIQPPGVTLSAAQRDFWARRMGQLEHNGETLYQKLKSTIDDPRYATWSLAKRATALRSIALGYKQLAYGELLAESPKLGRDLRQVGEATKALYGELDQPMPRTPPRSLAGSGQPAAAAGTEQRRQLESGQRQIIESLGR